MNREPTQRELEEKVGADAAVYKKQQEYNGTIGGLILIIAILVIIIIAAVCGVSTNPY